MRPMRSFVVITFFKKELNIYNKGNLYFVIFQPLSQMLLRSNRNLILTNNLFFQVIWFWKTEIDRKAQFYFVLQIP